MIVKFYNSFALLRPDQNFTHKYVKTNRKGQFSDLNLH